MVIEAVPKLTPTKKEDDVFIQQVVLLAAREKREIVTAALAARLLGKSRDTIYRWLEEGKLSGRKLGGRWIVYQDSIEAEWAESLVERE